MNIAGIRLRWGLEAPSLQVGRSWRDVKLSAGKILITGVASQPYGARRASRTRRPARSVLKQLEDARAVGNGA